MKGNGCPAVECRTMTAKTNDARSAESAEDMMGESKRIYLKMLLLAVSASFKVANLNAGRKASAGRGVSA